MNGRRLEDAADVLVLSLAALIAFAAPVDAVWFVAGALAGYAVRSSRPGALEK